MTEGQRDVLLALNLVQMQNADGGEVAETGVYTEEIAAVCGRSKRSTAALLSSAMCRGWVEATHGWEWTGWTLLTAGVDALEATREPMPSDMGARS